MGSPFSTFSDDLRKDDGGNDLIVKPPNNNPFYKSIMCKNKTDCAYGEQCVYAHNESELRILPKVFQTVFVQSAEFMRMS